MSAQIEDEIAGHTAKLSLMVQQLENAAGQQNIVADIAMLVCFIKRRCNLFFREQEISTLPASELTGYLDELAEIASYSEKMIAVSCDVNETLSVRRATLFYDFFHAVIDWAAQQSSPHVMAHLRDRNGTVIMRLLPYTSPKDFTPDKKLSEAIALAGGKYGVEDLDDATAISLTFPLEGDENG